MVCSSHLRTVILQAGNIQKVAEGLVQFANFKSSLKTLPAATFSSVKIFPSIRKMMVDNSASANRGLITDTSPEKDNYGGYASGGWKSEDGKLSCGYSSFRGKRVSMEDFYDVKTCKINGQTVCLFGIFDGHGGSRAAEYLKENLFKNLMNHPKFLTNTRVAISETYQQTDSDFLESGKDTFRDDGSTASTAVLVGNHLYVANVGDSRTVLSKAGKAIPLSDDHKPNRSDERKRIESAGGVVMWAGTWRVGGVLAMSRAFGNRMLKQFVVAEPEIQEQELDEEFELLVLASDGLWDVVPNEDAVSLALLEEEPESAARKLIETAFSRGSADNITCIVVRLYHHESSAATAPEFKPQPPKSQSETETQIQPENELETETEIESESESRSEETKTDE
ncbi:probable protein phosphatase 2C 76 [Cynara cardunculus var. scolymus]|uniref:probable protein phosphatase 2C 76 n=1 Tax=Cynara cardunculus var. scolymus TaxID=59895 RepID=UPI000D62B4B9|nr:probable protein phosphatase 2C 76 [Cynara cardunculus var. scolymus]XP_024990343.1 probable protein phosphatase 2C 76 [Cynara cardunculus var. scolymus]